MSEAKFTQGPWSIYLGHVVHQSPSGNPLTIVNGDAIHADPYHDEYMEEARANTHLISAAPEMYQIVQDLMEELRLIRMKDTNAVYDPTVRIRAEIVLAKAEGRV